MFKNFQSARNCLLIDLLRIVLKVSMFIQVTHFIRVACWLRVTPFYSIYAWWYRLKLPLSSNRGLKSLFLTLLKLQIWKRRNLFRDCNNAIILNHWWRIIFFGQFVDNWVCVIYVFRNVLLAYVILIEPLLNGNQMLHSFWEVFLLLVNIFRADWIL